jgi:tyrosyl-tRNA synthetase
MRLGLGEGGAALGIGALLKMAGLADSGSAGNRLIDGGGVRVDSIVVSDKALKLGAGTYVLQVGKRKFVRVTLA